MQEKNVEEKLILTDNSMLTVFCEGTVIGFSKIIVAYAIGQMVAQRGAVKSIYSTGCLPKAAAAYFNVGSAARQPQPKRAAPET